MVWRLLKKLKIRVSYNSAIPILDIYPKELKSGFQNDISTPRFIVSLYTIAKIWKQSKCSSGELFMNKENYICIYSAIERRDTLSFVTT